MLFENTGLSRETFFLYSKNEQNKKKIKRKNILNQIFANIRALNQTTYNFKQHLCCLNAAFSKKKIGIYLF